MNVDTFTRWKFNHTQKSTLELYLTVYFRCFNSIYRTKIWFKCVEHDEMRHVFDITWNTVLICTPFPYIYIFFLNVQINQSNEIDGNLFKLNQIKCREERKKYTSISNGAIVVINRKSVLCTNKKETLIYRYRNTCCYHLSWDVSCSLHITFPHFALMFFYLSLFFSFKCRPHIYFFTSFFSLRGKFEHIFKANFVLLLLE